MSRRSKVNQGGAQWPWSWATSAGGSKLISGGSQPKSPCTQPQKSAIAASRPQAPSCHQKFGTRTPRQSQWFGAICDHAMAAAIMSKTAGAQAPWPSIDQIFFQSAAHNHQATQSKRGSQFTIHIRSGYSNRPSSTPICSKISNCSDMAGSTRPFRRNTCMPKP